MGSFLKMSTRLKAFQADRVLRDLLGEDSTLAIDTYLCETPFALQKLNSPVMRRNVEFLAQTARVLRKASAQAGAQTMAQLAAQLENAHADSASLSVAHTVLQRLQVAFVTIAPQLRAYLREKERLLRVLS